AAFLQHRERLRCRDLVDQVQADQHLELSAVELAHHVVVEHLVVERLSHHFSCSAFWAYASSRSASFPENSAKRRISSGRKSSHTFEIAWPRWPSRRAITRRPFAVSS